MTGETIKTRINQLEDVLFWWDRLKDRSVGQKEMYETGDIAANHLHLNIENMKMCQAFGRDTMLEYYHINACTYSGILLVIQNTIERLNK